MPPGGVFDLRVLEERPGFLAFEVDGPDAALFHDEVGGHRWQRVPPNEKRGRVHTSTVTVAVLPTEYPSDQVVSDDDLEVHIARGTGRGGQARNVTDTAVTVRHKPTGITARCDVSRSQHENRKMALFLVRSRIWERERAALARQRDAARKEQVGTGMRGDKRRTIRQQDGVVTDHLDGRRWRLRDYLRGEWA